jgi:hypothetical protein
MITAKSVIVLGCPVGNLWDIYSNDEFYCRVTYHGNKLERIRKIPRGIVQYPPTNAEVEAAIEVIYAEGKTR